MLLIANTIRLSIHSRRREIEVMKLVGATNWFVRLPFIIEGMLCGLVGAAVAIVLLYASYVGLLREWIQGSDLSSSQVQAISFWLLGALLLARRHGARSGRAPASRCAATCASEHAHPGLVSARALQRQMLASMIRRSC